jgi:sensor histidine kinase YesM
MQPNRKADRSGGSFSTLLGLVISIPINLASTYFQWYIASNMFATIIITFGILYLFYYLIKKQDRPTFTILLSFVASISVNLLSSWILQNMLHNSFPPSIVIAIFVSPIIGFAISYHLKEHSLQPITKNLPENTSSNHTSSQFKTPFHISSKQRGTFLSGNTFSKTQEERKHKMQEWLAKQRQEREMQRRLDALERKHKMQERLAKQRQEREMQRRLDALERKHKMQR